MKSYCLYCKTGSEEKLVYLLKKDWHDFLDAEVEVLYPTKIMNQRKRRIWRRVTQPLMPGYIFLFLPDEEPFPSYIVKQERDAYKILRYSDGTLSLKGPDEAYANWIYSHQGVLPPSKVLFKEGQIVKILEGPLSDFSGRIVKVDRHHKRVVVGFLFAGQERRVNLSIDIIDIDLQAQEDAT